MTLAPLTFAVLGAVAIGAPPGTLIDIGGRKLHVYCTGSGAPNVILEAGAGAFATDWALVQPEIARTNRVCSYDRAGLGWSDPAPGVPTPASIVADLHAALRAAGVKPPYVMVGASMGGIYVRTYDLTYPGEVAGLVLVDPVSEERLFTMLDGKGVTIASLTAEQLRSAIPPGPATVPRRSPQTGTPFDLLPHRLYETRVMLETRQIASIPTSVPHDVVVASAEGERAALARLHAFSIAREHPLGDRPLVVLTRGMDSSRDMKDAHAALARQSTNSRHTVVAGAGHEIHLFKPAAAVQAIRDVVNSVRTGKPLNPTRP
jgi:pimeloyl-ACP methyl ester carboxylesterase